MKYRWLTVLIPILLLSACGKKQDNSLLDLNNTLLQHENVADLAYLNSLLAEPNTGSLRMEHIEGLTEMFTSVDWSVDHHFTETEVNGYIEFVEEFRFGFFKVDHDTVMLKHLKAMEADVFSNPHLSSQVRAVLVSHFSSVLAAVIRLSYESQVLMDEYYTLARQLPSTEQDDSVGIEVFFVGIKKAGVYTIDDKEVTNRDGSAIIYTDKRVGEKCKVKVAVKSRMGVINEYPIELRIE